MKHLPTILLCLIGCAHDTPDLCRVTRLQTMLAAPVATDTTPEPERTDNESGYKIGDHCLIDYYLNNCPPCERWDANEKDKVDCKVQQFNVSDRPVSFVSVAPSFRLLWCSTETKQWEDVKFWTGFTSAADINAAIQDHKQTQQTQSIEDCSQVLPAERLTIRRTAAGLRQWITQHYNQRTPLRRATVNPKSFVWKHLRNDHGFEGSQTDQLPQWMALALHDAVHGREPLVTAWVTQ